MDALVTDAHIRAVVAGLRGLGRSGARVLALGHRRSAAGLWSRYAAARVVGPGAAEAPVEFADLVGRLASEHGPLVVYPGSEPAIDALVSAWPRMPEGAVLPYPGPDPLEAIRDKGRLPALAEEAGLRAPKTLAQISAEERDSISLTRPFIVKRTRPGGRLTGAYLIESSDGLQAWARSRRVEPQEPLLIQEWVRGPLVSVELVLGRDGTVVERFQHVTERTWPRAAGSISSATSVPPDERLVDPATRLLRQAGYWGLAQLDFVRSDDGPVLVDVNPRFYSCLPLALACGVNLPAAWQSVALDDPVQGAASYRAGVGFRWLEGDLLAAVRGTPQVLLRRPPAPRAGAMWAGDDPLPAALMGIGAVTLRVRNRLPGRA